MSHARGHLITVEGIDGAGKSTQVERVATLLAERGHTVVRTREPGGTPLGLEVRRLVLETELGLTPFAELLLFLADRSEHVARVIKPNLDSGAIVLCDRFSDSTLAYQGYGRQGDIATLRSWDAASRDGVTPDLTLLLDCPVAVAETRRQRSGDRYQTLDEAFHERVRQGFLAIAQAEPDRVRRVDTARARALVDAEIDSIVLDWIRGREAS